jgi:hypothetical protein
MKDATSSLVWVNVDVASLPKGLAAKYAALKAAQEATKKTKEAFESEFIALARKGDRLDSESSLAFGYRFGKLSVAKTDAEPAKKADTKPVFRF